MRGTNQQIVVALLVALTLGVWGLLARSFFPLATGSASPAPTPTPTPMVKQVYVVSSDKDGKIFFDNSPGNIAFTASGLGHVLQEAAKRGIKIHSIVSPSGIGGGGYVVFVEN
jgi:hypothetical protein